MQKIVQTRGDVGLVLSIGNRLVTLTMRADFLLSVVERTTAECLQQQQLSLSPASRASLAFKSTTRAATSDAFSGDIASEKSIAMQRRRKKDDNALHILCDVHGTAGVHDKTFLPLDSQISGLINTALALRSGAAMSRVRKCLMAEIASHLGVLQGSPPEAAEAYKRTMLRIFIRHGSATLTKRALLSLCPNGDWRAPMVQYYVRTDTPLELRERDKIIQHLSNGLTIALASSRPALYNRSKWTGSDIAVDDLGVFESVHRRVSTTFARFCADFCKGALRRTQMMGLVADLRYYDKPPILELPGGEYDYDEDERGDVQAGSQAEQVASGGARSAGSSAKPSNDADASWAQENAKNRRLGIAFVRDNPLGKLLVIRIVMEPLRRYLGKQFERASEAWSIHERRKCADANLRGVGYMKRYRIVEVAQGVDDDFFFHQLDLMSGRSLWHLPPSCYTVSDRAQVFMLISRMGCAFERTLASRLVISGTIFWNPEEIQITATVTEQPGSTLKENPK